MVRSPLIAPSAEHPATRRLPTRRAPAPWPPEVDLLLCCARTGDDSSVEDRIDTLISAGIDWRALVHIAQRQCVLPQLYLRLKRRRGDIPPAVLEGLAALVRRDTARSLFLTSELIRLLDLLAANGVTALPLKGPVVGVVAYGSASLRQFKDLDIYVHPTQVLRAKQVLIADAYDTAGLLGPAQETVGLHQHRYHHQFVQRDGDVLVELHWGICEWFLPFSDASDRLFEGLVPIRLAGRTVMSLAPEMLLQYLCVHGTKHLWSRLKLITDVAMLIQSRPDWNWQRVLSNARENHLERPLLLGLHLARDLLGADVPLTVLRGAWTPDRIQLAQADVTNRLWDASEREPGSLESFAFYLRLSSGLSDKARYCLRFAVHNTIFDWTVRPLPRVAARGADGLLRRARTPSTRALALIAVAFVSGCYYVLLPPVKRLRDAGRWCAAQVRADTIR